MSKSEHVDELYDMVETESSIGCDKCDESDYQRADGRDAAEWFYNKGWRIIMDQIYCPKCANKHRYE